MEWVQIVKMNQIGIRMDKQQAGYNERQNGEFDRHSCKQKVATFEMKMSQISTYGIDRVTMVHIRFSCPC